MKKYIIGGLIVLLIGGGGLVGYYELTDISPEQETTITLATFNLEKLSESDPFQIQNAVKIIRQFDIVAIQEVMNSGDGLDGPRAVKMIEASLGAEWESIISDEANGTASAAAPGVSSSSGEGLLLCAKIYHSSLIFELRLCSTPNRTARLPSRSLMPT